MAQQRRAEQRKKEAQKNMLKKIGMVCIPVLALIGLFVIGTMDFDKDSSAETTTAASTTNSAETTTTSDSAESTTEAASTYLTDEELTVKDGDTVNIDYIGYIGGEEFEGGNTKEQGTDLVIGSGDYIDDFEEQLIGAHPGDVVEVRVTFPEDYYNETYAGQDALFITTVNGIYE